MKIKTKMQINVGVFCLTIGAILVAFALFMGQLSLIDKEEEILLSLEADLTRQLTSINLLIISPITQVRASITESQEVAQEGFTHLQEIVLLKGLSPEISNALDSIASLKTMQDVYVKNILDKLEEADKLFPQFGLESSDQGIYDVLMKTQSMTLEDKKGMGMLLYYFSYIKDNGNVMGNIITINIDILRDQYSLIRHEIKAYQSRMIFIMIGASLIVIVLILAFSLWSIWRMSISLGKFEKGIASLSKGDLTYRFKIVSRDELQDLGTILNRFLDTLGKTIQKIQTSSFESTIISDQMTSSVGETVNSVFSMKGSVEEINDVVQRMGRSINNSGSSVTKISEIINSVQDMIQGQASMVDQTNTTVSEINGSLDLISSLTNENRQVTNDLKKATSEGQTQLLDNIQFIEAINNSISNIQEMVELINSIADQTNILSMNAAIEAAHAGESGKGFAVVADEIRKLAEASSENSMTIGTNLNEMIENIQSASISGIKMKDSFFQIISKVDSVNESFSHIYQSVDSLKIGGHEIIKAMGNLEGNTKKVQDGSMEMGDCLMDLTKTFDVAAKVSKEVEQDSEVINEGIIKVNTNVENIKIKTSAIKSANIILTQELEFFTTEDEDEPEEIIELKASDLDSDNSYAKLDASEPGSDDSYAELAASDPGSDDSYAELASPDLDPSESPELSNNTAVVEAEEPEEFV